MFELKSVAIIPARGGSKRIPRKNIRQFNGVPILKHAINLCLTAKCFDRVIVSTEDYEIADLACEFGAEVPFLRPEELATDHVGTLPVIQNAIHELSLSASLVDCVFCIYPTTPFLTVNDLLHGLQLFSDEPDLFVYAISQFPHPPQRALRMNSGMRLSPCNISALGQRTQDLENLYHDLGQFYIASVQNWLMTGNILGSEAVGVVIPSDRAVDIDTLDDWRRAELMHVILQNKD